MGEVPTENSKKKNPKILFYPSGDATTPHDVWRGGGLLILSPGILG
jgi:hypothetical protein